MADFEIMLESKLHGPFFRNVDSIEKMHGEAKRIERVLNVLYLLTFLGALVVLAGPLPEGAKFSAFGVEAPISALPQQVLALLTAALFGYYGAAFASMIVLTQMLRRVLIAEGHESWQFFAAPFNGSQLWSVATTPKQIGYRSPRREILLSALILLVALGIVAAHACVIVFATVVAAWSAVQSGSVVLSIIGVVSAVTAGTVLLGLLALIAFRMPYRLER